MEALGKSVLIKPDILPERTQSGNLVIPKSSKSMLPEWGTVVDAGPACEIARKGMRVNFSRKGASVQVIDNEDFYWITEHRGAYFEEVETLYTLTCDVCKKPFKSNIAFPKPQICPTCYF